MTIDATDFFSDDTVPEPPQDKPVAEPDREYPQDRGLRTGAQDLQVPANIDAEKTVLACALLDNNSLKEIALTLNQDDFFLDSNKRIFLRMAELWDAGKAVDIVTLSNQLNKHKEIEAVGGVAYLAALTEGVPRLLSPDAYVRILKDKAVARRLISIASAAIARAADQSEDAVSTLQFLETEVESLRESSRALIRDPEPFFVGARTFIASAPEHVDWTVEGIIQREGNGLVLGDSGTSKSVLIFDLALHMVAGIAWFQHRIPKRVKVGLVAREDAPGLSQSRLKKMLRGASISVREFIDMIELDEYLYVNTRSQRESWTLQSNPDLVDIIESIKERQIEFVFFDVFRDLWEGNENDNQETARVLAAAKRISREGNCQVCIVHHLSKSDKGTIFDRARGGGINGWKEWGMGITVENPEAEPKSLIRKIQLHTKADVACPPIYYRLLGGEDELSLEQIDAPAPQPQWGSGKKGKGKKPDGPKQQPMNYDSEPDSGEVPF